MPAPSPETIALVRERYARGDRTADILADAKMNAGTLYFWIDGGPDDGSGTRLPPIPRRYQSHAQSRRPRPRGSRKSVVKRLWRTAEWQVRDIEDRLRMNQQEPDQRERDARLLAIMVKTVRELRAMDDQQEATEDDGPDNLDDFRRDLARRIEGIVARRAKGTDRGNEG